MYKKFLEELLQIKSKYKCYRIVLYILSIIMICFVPSIISFAAPDFRLTYDNKTVNYTGKQALVQLDGKSISVNQTPGILINGYALLSYQDIFKMGLGADCTYNSTTKEITIAQNNVVIIMKLGSMTAYVNGVKTQMPVSSKKIKYIAVNKTKIMVPARFVAEALGYTYTWNSKDAIINMTSPLKLYYDNAWSLYNGAKGNVTFDGNTIDVSNMPSVIIENVALLQAKKVFQLGLGADYFYDKATNTVTISKNENTIVMTLGSTQAIVNNTEYTMDSAARVVKTNKSKGNFIMVPGSFVTKHLGYSYVWNKNTKTSVITSLKDQEPELDGEDTSIKNYIDWTSTIDNIDGTEYINLLKKLSVDHSKNNDIITLEGLSTINATVTLDESLDCIYIDIPGTLNGIGEKDEVITDGYCIKSIKVTSEDKNTRITIMKTKGSEYYSSSSSNKFMLILIDDSVVENDLKINLPKGVKYKHITNYDQYYNERFVITIPGDFVNYYLENPILNTNSVIQTIEVTLGSTGNTDITVTTSKLQGYQLTDNGSYFTVKVGDPADIYQNIVVLDAGHGGTDPGAIKGRYNEKDINYAILYEKAKEYFNSPDSNVKAYWTRTTDIKIQLADRAAFASLVGADLFISLHANSCNSSTVSGMNVYYASNNNDTNQSGLSSSKLAGTFVTKLTSELGLLPFGDGVRKEGFYVLRENTVPAILIELGFMTNANDLAYMTDVQFQDNCAKTIYNATSGIFNKYPTGR